MLVVQGIRDLEAGALQTLELGPRVLDLKCQEQPSPVEHVPTGWLGRVIRGHEREAKGMVPGRGEIDMHFSVTTIEYRSLMCTSQAAACDAWRLVTAWATAMTTGSSSSGMR
jgi:hypothetical protein